MERSSSSRPWIVLVACVFLVAGAKTSQAQDVFGTGPTEIVSVSSSGEVSAGTDRYGRGPWNWTGGISGDGRYVVFSSTARNLAPNHNNDPMDEDIFLRDRQTGTTHTVSVGPNGRARGDSTKPTITPDGRYVVFHSSGRLIRGDGNREYDVYLRDLVTETNELISVNNSGEEGDDGSSYASITPDGRFVVFSSDASNFAAGDVAGNPWHTDVFVRDRQAGVTEIVSVDLAGMPSGRAGSFSDISDDGRYVVFSSKSNNLVKEDNNDPDIFDVFVRDRETGTTQLASVSSGGVQGNDDSSWPSISGDGKFVVFTSDATNLDPYNASTNPYYSAVFIRDLAAGTTEFVSLEYPNNEPMWNAWSWTSNISTDGRFVTFTGLFHSGPYAEQYNVWVLDRLTGSMIIAGVNSNGELANADSECAVMSPDGRFVSFRTAADNLFAGDTNGVEDVFLHDYWDGPTPPASAD